MRPAKVVSRAADYLERHDVQSPRPTAEVLLANVLGVDRAGLYARAEGLSAKEARLFGRALCRRCVGTPLQHLTGEQGFRRLILSVRPGVFVPRPETEVVVDVVLDALDSATARGAGTPIAVDVGTGTGAIALAIKDERPGARVLAIDVSSEAEALALENAAALELDIEVLGGDLLGPLPEMLRGSVDVVVANPPYVSAGEYEVLPADVRADPRVALVGDPGMYGDLLEQAARWLRPGGTIVVEIPETGAGEVMATASAAGFVDLRVGRDLAGRDRVVSGRLGAERAGAGRRP